MSTKKYKGPIETVEHAMMAHMVVTVECTLCSHWSTMWAWRIYEAWKDKAAATPLGTPVPGFWCRKCQRQVHAVITPGMR
jgi:hypothetical protein